jgi:hypothetical protein
VRAYNAPRSATHGEVVKAARRGSREEGNGAGATVMAREAARWLRVCTMARRTRP